MTDRELMQQALEALEIECKGYNDKVVRNRSIISALRERLAQPEQWKPVWIQPNHLQKARQAPFLCRVEPKQRDDFVPLYTTPPRREWVGLTDDDLKPVCDDYRILFGGWVHDFARAIEAKLKERNT